MFIDIFKNNGRDYIRVMKSSRVQNDKGQKVPKKTVIKNIGPLDSFNDGKPDYISRLRKSFAAGTPLIASLEPYCMKVQPREKYTFTFEEGRTAPEYRNCTPTYFWNGYWRNSDSETCSHRIRDSQK